MARIVGEKLKAQWNQPVVVENRPGANGNIAIGAVQRAAPDGYTFLFGPGAHLVINKILYSNPSADPDKLEPVSRIATNPLVLAVHPKVPAKTLEEFIAYGRANPGKLNYASAGNGGTPHLGAEMFSSLTGIKMTKITYKGVAPAMIGLIAGEVDLIFVDISTAIPIMPTAQLRVLGVASEKRVSAMPDTPAIPEVLPGMTAETWFSIAAPPKVPKHIIEKVSAAVAEAIRLPDVQKRFAEMGNIESIGSTPEEMATFIKIERTRWGDIIRETGTTAD
jgi:tripartite-type tricarboxylate transporter receptor subunit TctC